MSVYGICPNISNRVGVNAAVCKRAVWINSFKRSAFVYPHRNKLYRWVFENMKFRCSDGHDEIWRMNLDEEAKVKDGETVMVIFMPTAMEMRLERLPYMDKIWEG